MSRKLWVTRMCVELAILLQFIVSSYAFNLLMIERFNRWNYYDTWERLVFYLSSVLLQIIAGVLLVISPEVFFNLRKVRFSPTRFIASAIIPILVLEWIAGLFLAPFQVEMLPLFRALLYSIFWSMDFICLVRSGHR